MQGNIDETATLGEMATNEDLVSAYTDDLAGQLADKMAMTDVGIVPILDRATQRVVGLVTLRDLIRVRTWRIREERERRRVLRLG